MIETTSTESSLEHLTEPSPKPDFQGFLYSLLSYQQLRVRWSLVSFVGWVHSHQSGFVSTHVSVGFGPMGCPPWDRPLLTSSTWPMKDVFFYQLVWFVPASSLVHAVLTTTEILHLYFLRLLRMSASSRDHNKTVPFVPEIQSKHQMNNMRISQRQWHSPSDCSAGDELFVSSRCVTSRLETFSVQYLNYWQHITSHNIHDTHNRMLDACCLK
jgi:hypothetical protein